MMAEFDVSRLKGTAVSGDGRDAILKFEGKDGDEVSIKIDAMSLAAAMQDIGSLLIRSRELSEISKQNIVPIFRPIECRADLVEERIVLSFRLDSGLENHYGIALSIAETLMHQMLEAILRHKKAKPESRH